MTKSYDLPNGRKMTAEFDENGICKITVQALDSLVDELNYYAEQEPKTGHWILLDECANSGYYCAECQKKLVKEGWSKTVKKINFCPNCGAKMVEPQESEETETWNGIHAQITAPKGTFDRIFNDADDDEYDI